MKVLLIAAVIGVGGACVDSPADPPSRLCRVGRDCPDAGVTPTDGDAPPSCDGQVPVLPPCTCGVWICTAANGAIEQHNVCGPQCDAGAIDAH